MECSPPLGDTYAAHWENPSAWAEDLMFRNQKLIEQLNEQQRQLQEFRDQMEADLEGGKFDGATFMPSVDQACWLSWTNDRGLDDPDPVNIKGDKGEDGGCFPNEGYFGLSVDEDGNLWEHVNGEPIPRFELEESGVLNYLVDEEAA